MLQLIAAILFILGALLTLTVSWKLTFGVLFMYAGYHIWQSNGFKLNTLDDRIKELVEKYSKN